MAISLVASTRGVALLPASAENFLTWSVVSRPLKGETPTIDLHGPTDRAPLSVSRLEQEFGWRARVGCEESALDLSNWWMQHPEGL